MAFYFAKVLDTIPIGLYFSNWMTRRGALAKLRWLFYFVHRGVLTLRALQGREQMGLFCGCDDGVGGKEWILNMKDGEKGMKA